MLWVKASNSSRDWTPKKAAAPFSTQDWTPETSPQSQPQEAPLSAPGATLYAETLARLAQSHEESRGVGGFENVKAIWGVP